MTDLGNVFVLGDSYSTFEGWVPDGYDVYYKSEGPTDVHDVNQTWWKQLVDATGAILVRNCSFSGTTICNTGYDGEDVSYKSFIARVNKLIESGFFHENKVDTFFIFGGTNDTWAKAPIGELQYSDWTKKDLYEILPAFCYLLDLVQKSIPGARIVVIMNTGLRTLMHRDMPIACQKYGVGLVELHGIEKQDGHPTVAGMTGINTQILAYLNS